MSLMAVPLARLRPPGARTVWLFASILTYAAAIALLLRHAPPKRADLLPLLVFLLLVNPPVLANLRVGQAYLFIAAGYALFAVALIRDRQTLAGATLGVLFALKATGAPLLLLLAATRRWRALAAGVAAIVFGRRTYGAARRSRDVVEYPNAVAGMLGRPTIGVTASQSTLSLARRLCVPMRTGTRRDLLGVSEGRCDRARRADSVCSRHHGVGLHYRGHAGVALGRHCAVRACGTDGRGLSLRGSGRADRPASATAVPVWPWIGLVAMLLLLPLRLTAFRFQDGWLSLVAYPRLYAAWLLWAAHVFGVRKWFRRFPESSSV